MLKGKVLRPIPGTGYSVGEMASFTKEGAEKHGVYLEDKEYFEIDAVETEDEKKARLEVEKADAKREADEKVASEKKAEADKKLEAETKRLADENAEIKKAETKKLADEKPEDEPVPKKKA